jgi:hypothetical protein
MRRGDVENHSTVIDFAKERRERGPVFLNLRKDVGENKDFKKIDEVIGGEV